MAATALTQKALTGDPTALPAQAALDAATLGGARLLGAGADLGTQAPGHPADLTALDLDHPGLVQL
jgi:5-methylthioadenosine/S-adenosylhomocysteine deaminase